MEGKTYRASAKFDLRELAELMPGILITGHADFDPDGGHWNPTGSKVKEVYSFNGKPVEEVIRELSVIEFDTVTLHGLPKRS